MTKKKRKVRRKKYKLRNATVSFPPQHKHVIIVLNDETEVVAAYQRGTNYLNIPGCWISLDGTIYDGTMYGEPLPKYWKYIKEI